MSINLDKELLESLQGSTCFGIAYEETVPECQKCDVKGQCKARSQGSAVTLPPKKEKKATPPVTDKKEDKKKTTKKSTTPSKTENAPKADNPNGVPDFKQLSLEELQKLADSRGVQWTKYDNDNITRMRLVMAIKNSYK